MTIPLVLLTSNPCADFAWDLGGVHPCLSEPSALAGAVSRASGDKGCDAILLWDEGLGSPSPGRVLDVKGRRGDVWHAGLALGMSGLPALIDMVHPTWMHNADPDPLVEATSWRLTARACLIKAAVIQALGGPKPDFLTVTGAMLEMGHRFIRRGATPRHVRELVFDHGVNGGGGTSAVTELPFEDELRFVDYRFGRKWAYWALARAIQCRHVGLWEAIHSARNIPREGRPSEIGTFAQKPPSRENGRQGRSVTVVIPTLDRYPYLRVVLDQLREQTVPAEEIIVVDQTPKGEREATISGDFLDLPIRYLFQEVAGQCTARNSALERANGEYILFIDDDDEVDPDLIERHLLSIARVDSDASCGVADEVGAGEVPLEFQHRRVSDVFPTNNTLLRTEALRASGLFDHAYDRGMVEDADLGMRLYLSGALAMLESDIHVLHHRAPIGGLRKNKMRRVTYASSRTRLTHRNLPSVYEFYLAQRYFSNRQVTEKSWLAVFGTFSFRGDVSHRLAKIMVGILLFPDTFIRLRYRLKKAKNMFETFPEIPTLPANYVNGLERPLG